MADDPNNKMEKDRDALLKLRQNLSVEADDDSVGSGLLVVHDDRHAEIQKQKEEKRKRERDSHNRTLRAMQDYIDDLQDQIDFHNQRIADLNEDRESFAKAIAQLESGELPELGADGKLKDSRLETRLADWEKRNGKVDRNDSAALLAAIQVMDAEAAAAIQDHEQQRNKAQEEISDLNRMAENGELSQVEEHLQRSHNDSASQATISENEHVSSMARDEMAKRNADGGGIEKEGQENFMDMFASAQELEVTENFNLVASGEIPEPVQDHSHEMRGQSMQFGINPMG